MRTERLQATTINRKIQALKKMFHWAREAGHVKTDASEELRFLPLGLRLRPPGLTESEVQALLRAAGQTRHGLAKRNYALVTLLVESGLRVGEVCQLRRGDLDVRDRSGEVQVREGKGRKERKVPLNSNARRALRLYLADRSQPQPEEYVFLSERGGKPLALRTVQATLAELGQRASIRRLPVTPHLMRHTFALRYLNQNPGKLVELALLGHESLQHLELELDRVAAEAKQGRATGVLRRRRSASTDTYRRFVTLHAVLQIDHTELPFPLVERAEGVEKLLLGMKSEVEQLLGPGLAPETVELLAMYLEDVSQYRNPSRAQRERCRQNRSGPKSPARQAG